MKLEAKRETHPKGGPPGKKVDVEMSFMITSKLPNTTLLVMTWLAVVLVVCCRASSSGADYTVSYVQNTTLEDIRNGAPAQHVRIYNSKLNEAYPVEEPFEESINVQWCDEWSFGPPNSRGYSFSIDFLSNACIRGLLDEIRGDHAAEIWHRRNSCFPSKGLVGLTCWTRFRGLKPGDRDSTIHLYCIYDKTDSAVIFVDREKCAGSRYWKPYDRGFFDVDGDHFYYSLDGYAKRFTIVDGAIDTIPGGDIPIVPWNRSGLAIYSSEESRFQLLDGSWKVVGEISGKFPGLLLLSSYGIDDSTYVIGVSYERSSSSTSLSSDGPHMMAIYVLDFRESSIRKLIDGLWKGQILSASRFE